jgi:hypothetical protein
MKAGDQRRIGGKAGPMRGHRQVEKWFGRTVNTCEQTKNRSILSEWKTYFCSFLTGKLSTREYFHV